MVRWKVLLALTCAAAGVFSPSSFAQTVFEGGLYEITSGRYRECCGIGGAFLEVLPNSGQSYLELTISHPGNLAELKILGEDRQTGFHTRQNGPGSGFTFVLTNGMVFPDHIRFGSPFPSPGPEEFALYYTVSNTSGNLTLAGLVVTPCPGCADIPPEFSHTNVVATPVPAVAIRVSEVEVCWKSVSNQLYQVQYRSPLTGDEWKNLGAPVSGNGLTNCIGDKVTQAFPEKYYRVRPLP